MQERPPVLPPHSQPDQQALRLPARRPAMPAVPAGTPPPGRLRPDARRALEAAERLGATAGRTGQRSGAPRTDLAVEA
ncbi:MAG: hypothetical protein GX496_04840, partial [Firmicutes bacterium]|nr:hypothetical protein [Bacillota bacterium]